MQRGTTRKWSARADSPVCLGNFHKVFPLPSPRLESELPYYTCLGGGIRCIPRVHCDYLLALHLTVSSRGRGPWVSSSASLALSLAFGTAPSCNTYQLCSHTEQRALFSRHCTKRSTMHKPCLPLQGLRSRGWGESHEEATWQPAGTKGL